MIADPGRRLVVAGHAVMMLKMSRLGIIQRRSWDCKLCIVERVRQVLKDM